MPKAKELVGQVEPVVEPTEPEVPSKTYSQEETDALLKEQYDKLNVTLSSQGAELKKLREKEVSQPDDTLLQYIIDEKKGKAEFGEADPAIARLEAELAQRKRKQTQETQLRWQEQVTQQWRDKFDQQIKDAGLNPQDERLSDFQDSFEDAIDDGKFEKAERKLSRALGKTKAIEPKKEGEVETEEGRVERLVDEKLRAEMEKRGLLTTETGGPSARGRESLESLMKKNTLKMSPSELKEHKKALDDAIKQVS